MTSDASQRLTGVIATLRDELKETEDRAAKLRKLVGAAEEFLGVPSEAIPSVLAFPPTTNGRRPPLRQAIVTVMRERPGHAWLLADLTDELWRREWVGGHGGKPSKESVRQALRNLRDQGMVMDQRQGDGQWSPTLWQLSNKMLTKAPDLS